MENHYLLLCYNASFNANNLSIYLISKKNLALVYLDLLNGKSLFVIVL